MLATLVFYMVTPTGPVREFLQEDATDNIPRPGDVIRWDGNEGVVEKIVRVYGTTRDTLGKTSVRRLTEIQAHVREF
jgi:hypothetical protein